MRSTPDNNVGLKGARIHKMVRVRRLSTFRNKRKRQSLDERLEREPENKNTPFPDEAPGDGEISALPDESSGDTTGLADESSGDTTATDLFADESSADPFLDAPAMSQDEVPPDVNLPDENSRTDNPTVAPVASATTTPPFDPSSTSAPTFDGPGGPDSPSAPVFFTASPSFADLNPDGPDTAPVAAPSGDSPFEAPSADPPSGALAPSGDSNLEAPSADPPSAASPVAPPNGDFYPESPITQPGVPTKPPKKTYSPAYPPAYFKPLPTPRPTNYHPGVPTAPKPTRRPSKLTPRPTLFPSISPQPSTQPTMSDQPSVSSAPSERPPTKATKAPTRMPVITPRPTVFETDSPTFKPSQEALPIETESPTFKPVTPAPTSVAELPVVTDPPVLPTLPPVPPTQDPATIPTTMPESNETAAPSTLPTVFDESVCVSDNDGNYGFPTAPNEAIIEYRFQLQATSTVTQDNLNDRILIDVEKDISDILIPSLFFQNGRCDTVAQGRSRGFADVAEQAGGEDAAKDKRTAQTWAMGILGSSPQHKKPRGSRTDGWESPSGRRQLANIVRRQQEVDELVGLTSVPPDFVIRGRFQNACPAPVPGNGPDGLPLICWVIEGAVTVYGSGDLSWVDPVVQESLGEAMDSGELDNGAVNPDVIYVRHIPPGTNLNLTIDGVEDGDNKSGEGTPVWAWILIGLGIFGLLLSIIYLAIKRRQQQEEFERQKAETDFFTGEEADGDEDDEDDEDDENENANLASGSASEEGDKKFDESNSEGGEEKNEDGDDGGSGDAGDGDVFNDDEPDDDGAGSGQNSTETGQSPQTRGSTQSRQSARMTAASPDSKESLSV